MSTVFNPQKVNHAKQPMFFGEALNLQRFDEMHYEIFDKLTQKQLGLFWRPEEVNLQKDRSDYQKIPEEQRHIFTSNLKYQIMLDSVQGRGPALAFLPFVSIPELESCILTWDFFETIHSRSYTHILKNVYADPVKVMDSVIDNEHIIKRSKSIAEKYNDFIEAGLKYQVTGKGLDDLKRKLYLAIMNVNILEGIQFYVSFACTFAFGELKSMEGSAKIIKFIARDEAQHLAITQHILKIWQKEDPEYQKIAEEEKDAVYAMFNEAVENEKQWAQYLFKDGSMIGLNDVLLAQYVEWLANKRLKAIGLDPIFTDAPKSNPLPWTEHWLGSRTVQNAPQETEIESYLVGAVKSDTNADSFKGFAL